jgi:hypothetical protein
MIEKYIETYRIAHFPYKLLKSAIPSPFIETVRQKEEPISSDKRSFKATDE